MFGAFWFWSFSADETSVSGRSHMSSSSALGSSTTALILRRKVTASLPSTRRWSYVSATYIIGRISACQTIHVYCDAVGFLSTAPETSLPSPYLAVDGHRTLENAVHAQDGGLWGVDDRRAK